MWIKLCIVFSNKQLIKRSRYINRKSGVAGFNCVEIRNLKGTQEDSLYACCEAIRNN